MSYKGYTVYDNQEFFDRYIQKRSKGGSPNDTLEKPIMDELVEEVNGKTILDLGCGDGNYGKELLERGAKFYHGVDGSENMIALAKVNLKNRAAKVEKAVLEEFEFPSEQYDLILSRLVFHYIENPAEVLNCIYNALNTDGEFVLSIEHPIITSCYDAYHQNNKRGSWIVDDYFKSGQRTNIWMEKEVIKYHKTIEEYLQLFKKAGLKLMELRESKPLKNNFNDLEEFERRSRTPLFMFFKLIK